MQARKRVEGQTYPSLFASPASETSSRLSHYLVNNPTKFMSMLMKNPDWFSKETAKALDELDPLNYTSHFFNIGEIVPFAGHSLGPVFQPAVDNILQEFTLQQQRLHEGHFENTYSEGKVKGAWFDRDRHPASLAAMKALWGFSDDREFTFSANGLSQNFALLADTFYRPGYKGWQHGKTKIVMLDTEFFSDQAAITSVLKRGIQTAQDWEFFEDHEKPQPEDLIIRLKPDEKGIYQTADIIKTIQEHAANIQMICLSDIVFGTGQRLELNNLFSALKETIDKHNIIVGLDLAHSVGNRFIDLTSMPVTFAVGCGYKHLTGSPGAAMGYFVSLKANLQHYPSLQGWKASHSDKVFPTINKYDASIIETEGAVAFRASNPSPLALMPVQSYLTHFNEIGFDKCFNKSECLTQYMIAQLTYHLGDKIEFITPLDPDQRGAMIVFRVKGLSDIKCIEDGLKAKDELHAGCYEIDSRPPNNIRMTAHYAYTKFEHIQQMVLKLTSLIEYILEASYTKKAMIS
jgi:kynureninase